MDKKITKMRAGLIFEDKEGELFYSLGNEFIGFMIVDKNGKTKYEIEPNDTSKIIKTFANNCDFVKVYEVKHRKNIVSFVHTLTKDDFNLILDLDEPRKHKIRVAKTAIELLTNKINEIDTVIGKQREKRRELASSLRKKKTQLKKLEK